MHQKTGFKMKHILSMERGRNRMEMGRWAWLLRNWKNLTTEKSHADGKLWCLQSDRADFHEKLKGSSRKLNSHLTTQSDRLNNVNCCSPLCPNAIVLVCRGSVCIIMWRWRKNCLHVMERMAHRRFLRFIVTGSDTFNHKVTKHTSDPTTSTTRKQFIHIISWDSQCRFYFFHLFANQVVVDWRSVKIYVWEEKCIDRHRVKYLFYVENYRLGARFWITSFVVR